MKTKPLDERICGYLLAFCSAWCQRITSLFRRSNTLNRSKPVQVYICLGQSNMLGKGKVGKEGDGEGSLWHAVHDKGLYEYLLDDDKKSWKVSENVRYVQVMGSGTSTNQVCCNKWMTIEGMNEIGPEFGISHSIDDNCSPILILKSCIGNRALGWDLLPPRSEEFEFTDSKNVTWVHPGYHGSPERWQKGTTPEPGDWYAGIQYDGDVARAKNVLDNLDTFYPGATDYEIAGFFWWQGDRDSRSEAQSSRYEVNLTQLIHCLRVDFDAPNAPFVCGTLGQTVIGGKDSGDKQIMDAMFEVEKDPQFEGTVAAVYTHPYSKGGSSGGHYNGNAETYMNVGQALGKKMNNLLERSR